MTNRFFVNTIDILPLSKARSSQVEANFTAVEVGFDTSQAEMDLKAPLASPTFTGTAVLPAATSIGATTAAQIQALAVPTVAEITTLSGVTNAIQTQLDAKAPLASPALTGTPTAPTPATSTNNTQVATAAFVQAVLSTAPTGTLPVPAGKALQVLRVNAGESGVEWVDAKSAPENLTNKTITDIVFAVTGTTPALTATNGAVQTWTLTAASAPTDALTTGQSIILVITPGAFAITWPAGTIWTKQGGSGAAPTLFSAGKTSVVLWKVGAVLYGSHLGDNS